MQKKIPRNLNRKEDHIFFKTRFFIVSFQYHDWYWTQPDIFSSVNWSIKFFNDKNAPDELQSHLSVTSKKVSHQKRNCFAAKNWKMIYVSSLFNQLWRRPPKCLNNNSVEILHYITLTPIDITAAGVSSIFQLDKMLLTDKWD